MVNWTGNLLRAWRAVTGPKPAPGDWKEGLRSRCIDGVRICAASDDVRWEYLGHHVERGLAFYDVLSDSIVDDVEMLEDMHDDRSAAFSEAEWADLVHLKDLVLAAGEAGDPPEQWEGVRELARAVVDRHGWCGKMDRRWFG